MQLGNTILTLLFQGKGIYLGNNIFLTLACGLLVLNLVFGFSKNRQAPRDEKRYLRLGGAVLVGLAGVLKDFFTILLLEDFIIRLISRPT